MTQTMNIQLLQYVSADEHPTITSHPIGGDVESGRSITLMCSAGGTGTLVYSWERRSSGSSWTIVGNGTSYTTDTSLTSGEYMYRCRVNNEAGSVVSNNATVNVFGKYCISCTTVVVHNRDQAEIFQNTLIERTPKAAFRALDFISKTF